MMSTIDETGLVIDRYDDTKAKFDADLKAAFGDGIKLGADSVFGQISAIVSERVSDQNELIELVAGIFNSNSAAGVFLSQLLKLNGLDRNEAEFSTVALDITANTAGASIAIGAKVSDPNVGEKFAIDAAVTLAPGETKTVSATAVNPGSISAPAGTLTKIENPTYGWESVTNASDASLGALEESDTDARIRRDIAASATGTSNAAAIRSAVLEVDGVDLAKVYENKSSITDSRGIPPHSIWVVARGGTDADLAKVIFEKTGAGCGWKGATTFSYSDPITGETYDVKFSRPTEVPIYVTYVLQKYGTYPSNGDDLIVENTVKFFNGEFYLNGVLVQPFGLDDDVIASRLYTAANTVPGHKILEVYIGTAVGPLSSIDVSIGPDQLAGTEVSKVVVE